MKNQKSIRCGALLIGGPIVACAGLLLSFYVWIISMSTYYTESYKPAAWIARGDQELLRNRFVPTEFSDCVVNLEWFTYDNADITTGPYKLFVVVEPQSSELTSVEIVDIEVISDFGNVYTFSEATDFPLTLESDGSPDPVSHTFEPAFSFGFDAGEKITTEVQIRIHTTAGTRDERIEIEWHPVRVRHWSSIV